MTSRMVLLYVLAGFGTFTVASLLLSTVRVIYRLFLRRSTLPRYIKPDANGRSSWALITGASDGIGLALAHELCARGANVVLHGRNPSKLANVRKELLARYPERKIETVVADAGREDTRAAVEEVVKAVQKLPDGGRLRILINNVGGSNARAGASGPIFHRFNDLGQANIDAMINVNIRFGTLLTAALFPVLTADNTPSLVLNLTSMASIAPLPYMVVYCASKSYVQSFSATLAAEVEAEGKNLEVMALITGDVDTPGAPTKSKAGVLAVQPAVFARGALNAVGCGESAIAPGWHDWLTEILLGLSPQSAINDSMKGLFERMQRERKSD